jgi:catechol 2,3-dioxygenase-like lactoylglutathione lyase family enzyme
VNWSLEVVVVPVSDIDRAKSFYADKLGFTLDHDIRIGDGQRIVQLTPPGSGCSIVIGEGVVATMAPGSLRGLQLVVADVIAAHAQLVERGVAVGEVTAIDGDTAKVARVGADLDNVGFVFFDDPDGNGWAVQQISARG